MKEPLSDKGKKVLRWCLYLLTVVMLLVNWVEMGLTAHNFTYTSLFTPPSMQPALNDAYIYYYSQQAILALGLLMNGTIIWNCYASLRMKKKSFKWNMGNLYCSVDRNYGSDCGIPNGQPAIPFVTE